MVSSAVRAPLRSMIALVASVVPWITTPTSPGASPASASTRATASITPRSGAAWVVSTLVVYCAVPISSATSVKVPPMSTPIRAWPLIGPPLRSRA